MAKVTARKETGRLVIDFTYRAVRCREQTALTDSAANRRRLEPVVMRLKKALLDGTFSYSEFFPLSAMVRRFACETPNASATSSVGTSGTQSVVLGPDSSTAKSPLFSTFTATWLANHQVEWRRSHIKVLRSTIDGHLLPHFGERPVGSITKADILAFRTKLASLPGRGTRAGLSNKRINGILAPLRQMLNEAAEQYDFTSPMLSFKPLRVRKTDVKPFTLDEVQLMLRTVRPDYRDYLTIRFFTGMRTGEAHGLKWKYVDFANRLVLVRETIVLGEEDETKNDGSNRDIRMTQVVFEALQRQHAATAKLSEYVFCNSEGRPLDNTNFIDRVWRPLLRHLNLEIRRPYQMRHTAATLWLAAGEAPEWIARQLGHSTTEMLFKTYSRFVPNMTRQDGSAVDRLLATRFGSGQISVPGAAPSPPTPGAGDVTPPTAQPPPVSLAQAVPLH
jgi:integrase